MGSLFKIAEIADGIGGYAISWMEMAESSMSRVRAMFFLLLIAVIVGAGMMNFLDNFIVPVGYCAVRSLGLEAPIPLLNEIIRALPFLPYTQIVCR
jgi:hypothetical protein